MAHGENTSHFAQDGGGGGSWNRKAGRNWAILAGSERNVALVIERCRRDLSLNPLWCPPMCVSMCQFMFFGRRQLGRSVCVHADIRAVNLLAMTAKKTGMVICGGGVIKHHICNANLMRNGADFAVYMNTAQEFDGSDAGARPDEAVSWGKIRADAHPVKARTLILIWKPKSDHNSVLYACSIRCLMLSATLSGLT